MRYHFYGVREIESIWQQELDLSLETGEAPVFDLGVSDTGLDGMAAALAVALLDAVRKDVSAPLAMAGGTGPLWLANLFHQRPATTPPHSPATTVAYTAPDLATHMAELQTLDTRTSVFRRRPADLPPWVQTAAQPSSHPGAVQTWETFPLAAATLAARRDGWVAWSAVALAGALLLIALVT